ARFDINTNNDVEAWHRTLKQTYIPTFKKERADVLVYILYKNVLPDIIRDHVLAKERFTNIALSLAERR
ncbi:hypothetical protein DM01DRAFT_1259292, partial [Hesseltinella vesiculosa]